MEIYDNVDKNKNMFTEFFQLCDMQISQLKSILQILSSVWPIFSDKLRSSIQQRISLKILDKFNTTDVAINAST